MAEHSIISLDELALSCRDTRTKLHLEEALACYKVGAFRSCIVATWNAVVFDIIYKLGELKLTGDSKAEKKIGEIDKHCREGDAGIKKAQDLEKNILDLALTEFDLFSPLDKKDLERLFQDRNRCAHPSMQSTDDPYQPTAELARLHLRNAVDIVLKRPPVQGKAALDRIWQDIRSEYFPTDYDNALKYFENGPLQRARKSLIRSVIIGLTKTVLNNSLPDAERQRIIAALHAVHSMHRAEVETILDECLADIVNGVHDENLWAVVQYMRELEGSFSYVNVAVQNKITQYVSTVTGVALSFVVRNAMEVDELRESAIRRLGELSVTEVRELIDAKTYPAYIDHVIERFNASTAFAESNECAEKLIMPLASSFNADQYRKVLESIRSNVQIFGAWGTPGMILELHKNGGHVMQDIIPEWKELMVFVADNKHRTSGYTTELEAHMKKAGLWPES